MSEEDVGLPEESANKLDESNSVPVTGEGPWKNSNDMWTFQNFDDLEEYGGDIISGAPGSSATVVLVIDNEDLGLPSYEKNKHYWIIESADYGNALSNQLYFRHSVEYFSLLIEEGSATMEDFKTESNLDFLGAGRKKVDTYQGFPIYVRDPDINDNRPETETKSTTSAKTGNTVTTTTVLKPGTAGSTKSETTTGTKQYEQVTVTGVDADGFSYTETKLVEIAPDGLAQRPPSNVDATDPRGRNQQNTPTPTSTSTADPLDAFGGAGDAVTPRSRVLSGAGGKVESTGPGPCLAQNVGLGAGSTPPASVPYPDAILRQARAAAAAPASVIPNPDANDPRGRDQRNTTVAATATAPTPVTQPRSAVTSSSSSAGSPQANVYIYEPITPGFDRYDFNTGKKVYTPNNGASRNNNGQTVTPPQGPVTTNTPPPDLTVIPAGTTTGGPSRLRQRRDSERDPNRVGAQ
jgi:hypothetical protein